MKWAMRLAWLFDLDRYFEPFIKLNRVNREDMFEPTENGLFRFKPLPADEFSRWLNLKHDAADFFTGWMKHIPVVGQVVQTYWYYTIYDGTGLPLDGLAFNFLNDWMRPSAWHTWASITGSEDMGIYIGRAPKNAIEAEWVERNHKSLPLNERVDR
jgi:hypothetical protein